VDEHHLAGAGTSRVSWEPQGPVELVRHAPRTRSQDHESFPG
jgi:hypothetical protein